ncbi:MAG: hypothetical protein JWN72_306, partial [Thermoleophilia bacterium]|nr:hypothetical protein [Thermoleophilia bacterium]
AAPTLHRLNFDDATNTVTCVCGAWSGSAGDLLAADEAFGGHVRALRALPAPADVPAGRWLSIGVEVDESGTSGVATVLDGASRVHGVERWLTYKVRGACPAGWQPDHEFAHEKHVMPWKAAAADQLDRVLVQHCKAAFRLDGTPSYVVEFPLVAAPAD